MKNMNANKCTDIINNDNVQPIISVVMPVYNAELFLKDAIDSILNQTYANFEFIIIDDFSTDNSWDIIKSYSDVRIVTIRNDVNLGNYPSRNIGIKIAKGKYIAVMDSDDIAFPNRLEIQYQFMEEHSDVLACGGAYQIMNSSRVIINPLDTIKIKYLLLYFLCVMHPTILFRTEIIRKLGLYDEKYRYSSDYDLVCKLAVMGRIINVRDVLLLRRIHKEQISSLHITEQDKNANIIQLNYQSQIGLVVSRYDNTLLKHLSFYIMSVCESTPPGLFYGKTGMVIFFYKYADYTKDNKYSDIASSLLDQIVKQLHEGMKINLCEGISGIALGILYLLDNKFIDGDPDTILEEFDKRISSESHLQNNNLTFDTGIAGIIVYVYFRLKMGHLKETSFFDKIYLQKLLEIAVTIANTKNEIPWREFTNDYMEYMKGKPTHLDWNKLINLIIGEFPGDERISSWLFGLKNGCTGLGFYLINSLKSNIR